MAILDVKEFKEGIMKSGVKKENLSGIVMRASGWFTVFLPVNILWRGLITDIRYWLQLNWVTEFYL